LAAGLLGLRRVAIRRVAMVIDPELRLSSK
jgi:hypothetical protein